MQIETAREVKARLWQDVRTARHEPPQPGEAIAVGICASGDGYGLAIRHAGHSPLIQTIVATATERAGGECDVREIGIVEARQWEPAELQARTRPLRPGLSVAHAGVTAGTIGAFVTPRRAEQGESPLLMAPAPLHVLSNNHVLANSDQAAPGEVVLQPGPADGGQVSADRIGLLDRVVAMSRDVPNLVDAATAVLDDGVDVEPDHPAGALTGWIEPDVGVDVEKVGRTTGVTSGRISAIEVDGLTVQFPVGVITFNGQLEVSGDGTGPFSAGGDSGSVVYRPDSVEAVGLLFAGSERGGPDGFGLTYCNPIGPVLDQLDVDLIALEAEVTRESARAAKDVVASQLAGDPRVSGVGITQWHGRYAVQVSVVRPSDRPAVPAFVQGVRVQVVVTGQITPRS
jgi:hypothetical protein